MNRKKKTFYSVIMLLICFLTSCSTPPIPISKSPAEIPRVFNASFDRTWDSILEVVKASSGTIVTTDKVSGLIVYSLPSEKLKSPVYINVYLKNYSTNMTAVYLMPKVRGDSYMKEIDVEFFEKLTRQIEGR